MEAIKAAEHGAGLYSICGVAPFSMGSSIDKQCLNHSCAVKVSCSSVTGTV